MPILTFTTFTFAFAQHAKHSFIRSNSLHGFRLLTLETVYSLLNLNFCLSRLYFWLFLSLFHIPRSTWGVYHFYTFADEFYFNSSPFNDWIVLKLHWGCDGAECATRAGLRWAFIREIRRNVLIQCDELICDYVLRKCNFSFTLRLLHDFPL